MFYESVIPWKLRHLNKMLVRHYRVGGLSHTDSTHKCFLTVERQQWGAKTYLPRGINITAYFLNLFGGGNHL